MEYLIFIIIGMFLGGVITYFITHKKNKIIPSGSFIIDLSDPMKDVCKLELDEDLDVIYSKEQIILNIKTF